MEEQTNETSVEPTENQAPQLEAVEQPPLVDNNPTPKPTKKISPIVLAGIFFWIFVGLGIIVILWIRLHKPAVNETSQETNGQSTTQASETPTQTEYLYPEITPTPTPFPNTDLAELKPIESLNVSAQIKVAFLRDENLYLYEDGVQKLVAKPTAESSYEGCYFLQYPVLSPDGKYIAYIEQVGAPVGYGGCWGGVLRLVDIESNIITSPGYHSAQGQYYWSNGKLYAHILLPDEHRGYVIYDPKNKTEVYLASQPIYPQDGKQIFKPFSEQKTVIAENNTYYLLNPQSQEKTLLIEDGEIRSFQGWSPDGRYALFETRGPASEPNLLGMVWYAVDTTTPSYPKTTLVVEAGGAGGDFSVGDQWYFDKGFITYCSQSLSFVDGSAPLTLTQSGGGGCHSQGGFVTTTPNGQYALVKFMDRFELHTLSGSKQTVVETTEIPKGRGAPSVFQWLGNEYVVIFESTNDPSDYYSRTAFVHLYNRHTNQITPIIDDAYLVEDVQD